MNEPWVDYAPTYEQEQVWLDVLAKHGRPDGGGEPDVCDDTDRAVFDTEDDTREAIASLHEAGAPLLAAVPCERGEHWHLAPAAPKPPT